MINCLADSKQWSLLLLLLQVSNIQVVSMFVIHILMGYNYRISSSTLNTIQRLYISKKKNINVFVIHTLHLFHFTLLCFLSNILLKYISWLYLNWCHLNIKILYYCITNLRWCFLFTNICCFLMAHHSVFILVIL